MKLPVSVATLCFVFLPFLKVESESKQAKSEPRLDLETLRTTTLQKADSLFNTGSKEEALEMYFKSLNTRRPYIPLVFPILKKIGDIYLSKGEYQKAIYFLKEYQWMAEIEMIYSGKTLPDIHFSLGPLLSIAENWSVTIDGEYSPLSDSEKARLKRELSRTSKKIKELESRYLK